jgi:hypothetical protein
MRNLLQVLLAAVAASIMLPLAAQGATPASEGTASAAISGQLARCEQALNSADIEQASCTLSASALSQSLSVGKVGRQAAYD